MTREEKINSRYEVLLHLPELKQYINDVGCRKALQQCVMDSLPCCGEIGWHDVSAEQVLDIAEHIVAILEPAVYDTSLRDYGCNHDGLVGHIADEILMGCCSIVIDY